MSEHSGSQKVLIIALDGMAPALLQSLIDKGVFANIASLAKNGISGILQSTIPSVTAAAWTSFMTGKNPGKNGIYDFLKYDPYTNNVSLVSYNDISSATLWTILSQRDRKIGVINLPMVYPVQPVKGFMISGFRTPSIESEFTYPAELKKELLDKFPKYGFAPNMPEELVLGSGFEDYMKQIDEIIESRAEAAKYLMQTREWDVFMVHFQCTDILQHKLWGYIDPNANLKTQQMEQRNDRITKTYERLDNLIGDIISLADCSEAVKIVLSDHGFGDATGGLMYPNKILRDLGLLNIRSNRSEQLKRIFRDSKIRFIRKCYARLKKTLKDRKSYVKDLEKSHAKIEGLIDWGATKVYSLNLVNASLIYLNLIGRQPTGVINSKDCEKVINYLINELAAIRSPIDGAELFPQIYRGEELYPNADLNTLPDLICVPNNAYTISINADSNSIVTPYPPGAMKGHHRREGIFIAAGNGIKQNFNRFKGEIIDMAPTLLHMISLPVPDDMDGRVLSEIFIEPKPVKYEHIEETVSERQHDESYSDEDSDAVIKRLKSIGYLE